MTDTPTLKDMAQELAQAAATEACMTGYIGKDRLVLWVTDALTEAYERGQRDMRERAANTAWGFDVSENSRMMQPFVKAGLVAHLVRRDSAIGNALAALPINSGKEGG